MRLFTRLFLVLALLAALAPTAVFAQGGGELPCFGLSPADCELYYTLTQGEMDTTSFAMAYAFHLLVTGEDGAEVTSNGEGHFSLVPGATDPLASFSMDMVTENTVVAEGQTTSGPFEFRIIDGNFYANVEGQWQYAPLETLLESSNIADLESLMAGTMPGGMSEEEMAQMAEAMAPYASLFEGYITIERGADIQVEGNTVAVFNISADLAGLFSDPNLGQVIATLVQMSGEEMTEEEQQQMTQMMPMVVGMMGMFFANSSLDISTRYGVDNGYFYGFDVDFAMTIDPNMFAGLMGDTSSEEAQQEPVSLEMQLSVNLSQHNAEFTYQVPEGAVEVSPDEMMIPGAEMESGK